MKETLLAFLSVLLVGMYLMTLFGAGFAIGAKIQLPAGIYASIPGVIMLLLMLVSLTLRRPPQDR